jgi:hypothetical protein
MEIEIPSYFDKMSLDNNELLNLSQQEIENKVS